MVAASKAVSTRSTILLVTSVDAKLQTTEFFSRIIEALYSIIISLIIGSIFLKKTGFKPLNLSLTTAICSNLRVRIATTFLSKTSAAFAKSSGESFSRSSVSSISVSYTHLTLPTKA